MPRKIIAAAAAIAALTACGQAQAAVVLSDNFDSYDLGLNLTGSDLGPKWTIGGRGSVDIVGDGTGILSVFDYRPGNGRYVDLGGSSLRFGLLQSATNFAAGLYTLSFSLSGTARVPNNTTTVRLGDWSTSIALRNSDPFQTFTYNITTTGGRLSFQDAGRFSVVGNLLDNVVLSTAVPEPTTWALMVIGFGMVGAGLRRRNPVRSLSPA